MWHVKDPVTNKRMCAPGVKDELTGELEPYKLIKAETVSFAECYWGS